MTSIAFVTPILPGKEQADKDFLREATESRRSEYEESRRRMGIRREAAWHQQTPQGTMAIVYIEADDPGRTFMEFGTSKAPFDEWFRRQLFEVHGINFAEPPEGGLPELIMDESF